MMTRGLDGVACAALTDMYRAAAWNLNFCRVHDGTYLATIRMTDRYGAQGGRWSTPVDEDQVTGWLFWSADLTTSLTLGNEDQVTRLVSEWPHLRSPF